MSDRAPRTRQRLEEIEEAPEWVALTRANRARDTLLSAMEREGEMVLRGNADGRGVAALRFEQKAAAAVLAEWSL
jgi:hypothetical protein